jgi:hypothetical protein
MTELPAYLAGLIVCALFALAVGWLEKDYRGQLWRVAGALAVNWCAGFLYVTNTGNETPWQFSIFIDSMCAAVIMLRPTGRTQVYIGLFYMLQIACHIAYGGRQLLKLPVDAVLYYDTITWIAWAQLLAVGVWGSGIWGRNRLHRFWPVRHAPYRAARLRGTGER